MRIIFFILLSGIFTACSKNKIPDGVLSPEKMENVFWDYIRADVLAGENYRNDSSINPLNETIKLQKKVFALHNVTREQFQKSYTYYTANPKLMTVILDSIMAKQNRSIIKPANKNIKKYESL